MILRPRVTAVDLFCGAGGLSEGLQAAGIAVVAGIDVDDSCAFPFESNIEAPFISRDVRDIRASHLESLWSEGSARLLAGCAPCQPFSAYRRGADTSGEAQWPLLLEFARLIDEIRPELVTMENVPRVRSSSVFAEFVVGLESLGYYVDWKSCYGPRFGLPQSRRRLVLLASRLGPIAVPEGDEQSATTATVRHAIGALPPVAAGQTDSRDALHTARAMSDLNLQRIRASSPGGTWRDWPTELLAPCHRRVSGASFGNVYARMEWDKPAPTITTLAHNFGAGRFGHPDQDRPLTLREAAILQGFPPGYRFTRQGARANMSVLGRLIGNAVPPPIAAAIGKAVVEHVAARDAESEVHA